MVLGPDLVRSRRRGDLLVVSELKSSELSEVRGLAQTMLDRLARGVGHKLEDVEASLDEIERTNKYEKVWAGLKKILLEQSRFSDGLDADPQQLRKTLFEAAARARSNQTAEAPFRRMAVIADVAEQLEMDPKQLEAALFSDLKGAQQMIEAAPLSSDQLIEEYQKQHLQGVLLRAVKLSVDLQCCDPDELRRLFRKLKFRQLLFRLTGAEPGHYHLEIEGPFSLFEAVTKYGMQFALVLPTLLECSQGRLVADLRWGKERRPLRYERTWTSASSQRVGGEPDLRPELTALVSALSKKKSRYRVEPWGELLHIPGVGICVSDLKFSADGRPPVYLELMGFWSRDAVWARVEWAEAGPLQRVIFAASSRLRVSEAVLPEDSGASLYVFKGAMSAAAVLKRVEALSEVEL